MIEIKNLYKKFGNLNALNGLDLNICKGGIFAILGPNGSGKTTLIKCLLGMVVPNRGDILLNNESVLNKWSYRRHLSYLPQSTNFPTNLSVNELIDMVENIKQRKANKEELINLFGLRCFLTKKTGTLSGGTKQKVNLTLTFMFDSELIILDEPTTGLDPITLICLKKIILKEKAKGKTILITTHMMNIVEELADEIVFLLDGKMYFKGSVQALKKQTKHDNIEYAISTLMSKRYS